jgi:hypothetical protein
MWAVGGNPIVRCAFADSRIIMPNVLGLNLLVPVL